MADLVREVKGMQRSGKQPLWLTFLRDHGKTALDPNRHHPQLLEEFLECCMSSPRHHSASSTSSSLSYARATPPSSSGSPHSPPLPRGGPSYVPAGFLENHVSRTELNEKKYKTQYATKWRMNIEFTVQNPSSNSRDLNRWLASVKNEDLEEAMNTIQFSDKLYTLLAKPGVVNASSSIGRRLTPTASSLRLPLAPLVNIQTRKPILLEAAPVLRTLASVIVVRTLSFRVSGIVERSSTFACSMAWINHRQIIWPENISKIRLR